MGEIVEMKENDFWAKLHPENQKPPDSKARVRFLLDEIALLQTRFENNEHGSRNSLESEKSDSSLALKSESLLETPSNDEPPRDKNTEVDASECETFVKIAEEKLGVLLQDRVEFYEKVGEELRVGKVDRSELAELLKLEKSKLQKHRTDVDELHQKSKTWSVQNANPKAHSFWSAGQAMVEELGQLRDEWENLHSKFEVQIELGHFFRLLKLLELQKAKLENSRSDIGKVMQNLKASLEQGRKVAGEETQCQSPSSLNVMEDSIGLDRLTQLKQDPEGPVTAHNADVSGKDLKLSSENVSTSLAAEHHNQFEEETDATQNETCASSSEEGNDHENQDFEWEDRILEQMQEHQTCEKAAKFELSKLLTEQEKKWKARQHIIEEMERRLALVEMENQKLCDTLRDRQSGFCEIDIEKFSWTSNLPQGYSNIYFSPIFQERKRDWAHDKYGARNCRLQEQEEKDLEIWKLKTEMSNLKLQLHHEQLSDKNEVGKLSRAIVGPREERDVLDRLEVPTEEKTIPVDVTSNEGELRKLSTVLARLHSDFAREKDRVSNYVLSDDDKQFIRTAVQDLSVICQQHRQQLDNLGLRAANKMQIDAGSVERVHVESFNHTSEQIHKDLEVYVTKKERDDGIFLTKELHTQHVDSESLPESANVNITELENQIEVMKNDLVRIADEHAQQLDIKEKTLVYAQELNLQLANDMSKTENALADLRTEHEGLKVSLEAKLRDSRNEAEELANNFRKELSTLEQSLKEKEQLIQEARRRVQACQRETDAAVLEKNEALARLQRLTDEVEKQTNQIYRLQESNKELKLISLSKEAELGRSHREYEHVNQESSKEVAMLKDELKRTRQELNEARQESEVSRVRYRDLQSRFLETEYELTQREEALERLTLHLASTIDSPRSYQDGSTESLRSKHFKKERARKSIQDLEEKMAGMAEEMSKAKLEMAEMKPQYIFRRERMAR